ncbi:hypothetical protein BK125_04685 [Paenibacillus odorifer]|uniref:Carrier domain-containing protein n=1 Tax=Paenibacillus odorifer TaxID=189426 RepID=A0ABX3GCZ3_9BACL|nr:hypothetical protein [Paenibacillus odorifer]OMC79580.1 hypothetical protein BK125_04685 [Paenibacillus odorifer]OMC96160.1 hypothetical protein BSO21_33585 [Paenibacillus odorifer]
MEMSIEEKLKQVCKENGEIQIENITMSLMLVDVVLPYDTSSVEIELEGNTDSEIIESFIEKVNGRIDDMINELNDCKLATQD